MIINIFDFQGTAEAVSRKLVAAGYEVRVHHFCSPEGSSMTACVLSRIEAEELEQYIRLEFERVLSKHRGIWMVPSVTLSLVGSNLLDLKGNSGSIIFCLPNMHSSQPVYVRAQAHPLALGEKSRLRRRAKRYGEYYSDIKTIPEIQDDIDVRMYLHTTEFDQELCDNLARLIPKGSVIGSSTLSAVCDLLGIKDYTQPDYVGILKKFLASKGL